MMFENISVKTLNSLVNDRDVIIVDLRDESDYIKRHVKNAININYDKLFDRLEKLDKNRIIVLYCERGSLSLIAGKKLSDMGYMVKTVIGGFNMYKARYWKKNKNTQ